MIIPTADLPYYIKGYFKTDNVWVEPWRKQRSYRQLKLFWMWMGLVGSYVGESKEYLHDLFCADYPGLGVESVMVGGRVIHRIKGTRTLNTQEMSQFMDWVWVQVKRSLDWELPLPADIINKVEGLKNEARSS